MFTQGTVREKEGRTGGRGKEGDVFRLKRVDPNCVGNPPLDLKFGLTSVKLDSLN